MSEKNDCRDDGRLPSAVVRTLVISQHEAVRRQLVAYLRRLPALGVSSAPRVTDTIANARPDVLVLDLSKLGRADLLIALEAAQQVGARVVALASIGDPAEEEIVRQAGGVYRLKSAGADRLAEAVWELGTCRPAEFVASGASAGGTRQVAEGCAGGTGIELRDRPLPCT